MTDSRQTPARGRTLSVVAEVMANSVPVELDDGPGALILRRVSGEMADRLLQRGVHLTTHESPEQLTELLESVELFEAAVISRGGDLTVDAPVAGRTAAEPDHPEFILPKRAHSETVTKFVERVAEATGRIRAKPTRH
jgi:hypothetical protein